MGICRAGRKWMDSRKILPAEMTLAAIFEVVFEKWEEIKNGSKSLCLYN